MFLVTSLLGTCLLRHEPYLRTEIRLSISGLGFRGELRTDNLLTVGRFFCFNLNRAKIGKSHLPAPKMEYEKNPLPVL